MCGKEHISLVVHGLLFQQCLCLHQQGDNTSDCTECIINLKWSEMIWPGLTVWEHLTSDCSFWNQSSQTTRPPDHQTARPPDHQITRPANSQKIPDHSRPIRSPDKLISRVSDQSDHQTTRPPDYQTITDHSRPLRPLDQQISRVSDQSDKQTSRLTDYQTTPEQSDHQMSRLLDCQISQTTRPANY